ncbi:MAG: EAL domain-containing protein [Leptolyngbyaceae cyanobacterium]
MIHSPHIGSLRSGQDDLLATHPEALVLLKAVSVKVSQAEDFDAALNCLLQLVCHSTEWSFGEIWLPNSEQTLHHSGIWFAAQQQYEGFGPASLKWTFAAGEGLPGQVYKSAASQWIADATQTTQQQFPRRDLAAQFGLRAAVGVPVTFEDAPLIVLVFLANQAQECDRRQVDLVEAIAAHLGAILRLKRTEAQLIAHKQHLQRLFSTLSGVVFTAAGPPHWRMQSLSEGCVQLTGYSSSELTDENRAVAYNSITHPDDLPRVLHQIEMALAAGKQYEVEYRLITRDGEEKWVWEKGHGVFDHAGATVGLEGFITDISALKQTTAALQKSETRYRLLTDSSLELVSQHDLAGNIQYVSSACANLLGYAPTELMGKSPEWLLHPCDYPRMSSYYRKFLQGDVVPAVRFRLRHHDGHYRWFEIVSCVLDQPTSASESLVLAVSRDITAVIEAEQTLINREKFLNLVLDSIPQHLFWKDHNGIYLGCNQAFADGIGLASTAEVIGKTDCDIPAYSFEEAQRYQQQDQQIIETDRPETDCLEVRSASPQKWINVSKFPIHDAEHNVVGVLGSLEDISDRIEYQVSLSRREQYLTALGELQQQLLSLDGTWDNARFSTLLQPLAVATGANRVYIYDHDGQHLTPKAEWSDSETAPVLGTPEVKAFDVSGPIAPWIAALIAGHCINQTIDEFTEPLRQVLGVAPCAVKSILLLPLHIHGQLGGVIGFTNCQTTRKWSPSEIALLQVAANAIAMATERWQAKQSLHQTEAKYRSIFENALDGIFQTTLTGRYTTVNPMLARIYGYDSPQDLITNLVDIEQQLYVDKKRRKAFIDTIGHEDKVIGFESAVYRKDGEIIWISESVHAIRNANGELIGFEGSVKDITRRKQAETELHQRDRLLEGVAKSSQQLLTNLNLENVLPKILATLGTAAVAARVYIYENHPHPVSGAISMSMRYEWTQTGIPPSIQQPHCQSQSYQEHGLMRWYRTFQAGHAIGGRVASFPSMERNLLVRDAVVSILMVPIFIDYDLWGYIGFDACEDHRDWTQNDESTLVTIAASIGGALKRRQTEARMRHQAFHDPLTGLPNRTAFNRELPVIINAARRAGRLAAIMFLDLDRFKNINDTLGHAIGDKLLREVTQRLQEGLRRNDVLARWGGDEFTLILQNIESVNEAAYVAKRLAENLKPPFQIENHELYITCSIGIAVFPHDGDNLTSLLQHADAAMYAAKAEGRNTHRFYTSTLNSAASQQLIVEKYLHQALQQEEFRLYYQPQIDVSQGRICRIEALLRWYSPELGNVRPNQFIPIAEEIGLIIPLGDWVIKQACCQLKAWQEQGFDSLEIAVNLSARQLHDASLVRDIQQVLEGFDLAPQCLELEVTETAALANLNASMTTLNQLRQLGTRLVMDDFGTGYSSLNYLKQLPFHGLKIDRSFVEGIPTDPKDLAMLKAVVALGQALQLSIVAEGVETPEQASCLHSLGCNQMQGYWFSRPLDSHSMTDFLYNHWPAYNIKGKVA